MVHAPFAAPEPCHEALDSSRKGVDARREGVDPSREVADSRHELVDSSRGGVDLRHEVVDSWREVVDLRDKQADILKIRADILEIRGGFFDEDAGIFHDPPDTTNERPPIAVFIGPSENALACRCVFGPQEEEGRSTTIDASSPTDRDTPVRLVWAKANWESGGKADEEDISSYLSEWSGGC